MAMILRTARSALRQVRPIVSAVGCQTSRAYAEVAVPAQTEVNDDPVKKLFLDETKKFRIMLDELKKIPIPLNPDDESAMIDFTNKLRDIREKAGVPSLCQQAEELLGSAFEDCATVREYLQEAKKIRTLLGVEQDEEADGVLFSTLDAFEKELGRPLKTTDEDDLENYDAQLDEEFERLGLDEYNVMDEEDEEEAQGVVDEAEYEQTVNLVTAMRDAAYDAVKQAKASEPALADVEVTDEELGRAPPGA